MAYDDGSGWSKIGLDTSTDLIGCYPSIDIDDNDAVHVSYRDHRNSRFNYITNESGPWDKYQHSNTNTPGYYTQTKVKSSVAINVSDYRTIASASHNNARSNDWKSDCQQQAGLGIEPVQDIDEQIDGRSCH